VRGLDEKPNGRSLRSVLRSCNGAGPVAVGGCGGAWDALASGLVEWSRHSARDGLKRDFTIRRPSGGHVRHRVAFGARCGIPHPSPHRGRGLKYETTHLVYVPDKITSYRDPGRISKRSWQHNPILRTNAKCHEISHVSHNRSQWHAHAIPN
jgi:hypothetical protein